MAVMQICTEETLPNFSTCELISSCRRWRFNLACSVLLQIAIAQVSKELKWPSTGLAGIITLTTGLVATVGCIISSISVGAALGGISGSGGGMIAAAILHRVRPYIFNVTGKGGQWLIASGVVTLATGFGATIGYCASSVPVEGVLLAILTAGLGMLVECRSNFLYSVNERGYLKSAGLIALATGFGATTGRYAFSVSTGAVLGEMFGAGIGMIAAAATLSEVGTSLDTSHGTNLKTEHLQ